MLYYISGSSLTPRMEETTPKRLGDIALELGLHKQESRRGPCLSFHLWKGERVTSVTNETSNNEAGETPRGSARVWGEVGKDLSHFRREDRYRNRTNRSRETPLCRG